MTKEEIKEFLGDCYEELEKQLVWLDSDVGLFIEFVDKKLEELAGE